MDVAALRKAYQEVEFTDRLAALGAAPSTASEAKAHSYRTVETPADLDRLVKALKATKGKGGFALDTETTSVIPTQAELVGLSFSWKEGEAWYVPVNRDPPIFGGEVTRAKAEGSLFDEEGPRSRDVEEILARLAPRARGRVHREDGPEREVRRCSCSRASGRRPWRCRASASTR